MQGAGVRNESVLSLKPTASCRSGCALLRPNQRGVSGAVGVKGSASDGEVSSATVTVPWVLDGKDRGIEAGATLCITHLCGLLGGKQTCPFLLSLNGILCAAMGLAFRTN